MLPGHEYQGIDGILYYAHHPVSFLHPKSAVGRGMSIGSRPGSGLYWLMLEVRGLRPLVYTSSTVTVYLSCPRYTILEKAPILASVPTLSSTMQSASACGLRPSRLSPMHVSLVVRGDG